jgi:hypothetical protein
MVKVQDVSHLRSLIRRGVTDFLIVLGGGGLVSRKEIRTFPGLKKYQVFHGVDGTTETLTFSQILKETNIGVAIKKGCFFAENA